MLCVRWQESWRGPDGFTQRWLQLASRQHRIDTAALSPRRRTYTRVVNGPFSTEEQRHYCTDGCWTTIEQRARSSGVPMDGWLCSPARLPCCLVVVRMRSHNRTSTAQDRAKPGCGGRRVGSSGTEHKHGFIISSTSTSTSMSRIARLSSSSSSSSRRLGSGPHSGNSWSLALPQILPAPGGRLLGIHIPTAPGGVGGRHARRDRGAGAWRATGIQGPPVAVVSSNWRPAHRPHVAALVAGLESSF